MKKFLKIFLIILSVFFGFLILVCTFSVCSSKKVDMAYAAQAESYDTSFICPMPNGYLKKNSNPNIKLYYSGYFKIRVRTQYVDTRYKLISWSISYYSTGGNALIWTTSSSTKETLSISVAFLNSSGTFENIAVDLVCDLPYGIYNTLTTVSGRPIKGANAFGIYLNTSSDLDGGFITFDFPSTVTFVSDSLEPAYSIAYASLTSSQQELWDKAYDEGYLTGSSISTGNAYNDGYNKGSADGYNKGFEVGVSTNANKVNPLGVAVDTANKFLGMQPFGNGVTFGMLLLVPFGIALLGCLFRLFH